MSWFRSLRDEFTLTPFEAEARTRSDSVAMASGPPDVTANPEPSEGVEECSGKKKSKFQTFKKFFARKKRKEPPVAGAEAGLQASQSSDNVSKTSANNTLTRSEKDKGSGSKISLGGKALSHDSVFVSESSEANEALGASQDSIHGKVKSLQLQLRQAIRLGSPPSLMCVKRTEDAGTTSEDDGLPCSPPEYTALHAVMNQAERSSSVGLEGIDSDSDQTSSGRAVSPLVVPVDFSQPASPFGCLDNSAAKHKLGLRHKACNRRKPVSRLEMKAEETLNTSVTEASEEEREQRETTEVVSGDELKLKGEREEEDEEEEEEEPSRPCLLRDEEEREEEEDESRAELDVSHDPDSSSPPDPGLLEEEGPDARPPSSRTSSQDAPGAAPEPPAGPREYLLDPPGVAYGVEVDLALSGEEDGVQENREEVEEEESSFLQEVLSSLKTPLASCSLGLESEAVVLAIEEEVKEKERGDVEEEVKEKERGNVEEEVKEKERGGVEEEVKEKERGDVEEVQDEEDAAVDEPVGYQAAPAGSLLSDQTEEEEEEEEEVATVNSASCRDVEEEEKVEDEDEEAAEEEGVAVEQSSPHRQEEDGEKEEAEEVSPEEEDYVLTGNTVNQAEEEGREEEEEESEGEEEAIELEKEPEVEEEGREKREEEDEEAKEVKERVEEAEEAIEEEEEAEEMTEMFPDAVDEEVAAPLQEEEDEGVGVVVGDDDTVNVGETEPGDAAGVHESRAASEEKRGEEKAEEDDQTEQRSEPEDDDGEAERPDAGEPDAGQREPVAGQREPDAGDPDAGQREPDAGQREPDAGQREPVAGQREPDLQQEVEETSHSDTKQVDNEAAERAVASKPPSLSLPVFPCETQSQQSGTSSPSKTSTIHINLLSPSSEKATSFFQQSPTVSHPKEKETPRHAATEQHAASTEEEEEPADNVEVAEEEEQSTPEGEAPPPVSVEEEVNQPAGGSDQRSLSVGEAEDGSPSPSSPTALVSPSPSVVTAPRVEEAEAEEEPEVKAEPATSAKVEAVLSPGRARNAGSVAPSSIQPPTSANAEERCVGVEGNRDNPFGVRLRKTSVLHRFSSEEENSEPPVEPPAQPTSCRVDSPQPINTKPSVSQPVSNKPSLPKKPDVHGDAGGGKNKRISDPAPGRGVSAGSDSPSWISVAKQKQKIYKENSLEEITVRKEEHERKSSLPMYVSSASREHGNRTAESTGKVSPLETRRSFSPPTPVPPQLPKSQSLPCPVAPKPHPPPAAAAKHPPQPNSPQRSLSPSTPVPQKSPSCTSPQSPSKTAATSPKTLTSPPFSSRTGPEKSGSRAAGLPSQTQTLTSPRGLPAPALPQDEPPWMALAKKKAKAWSEMPQIVQ